MRRFLFVSVFILLALSLVGCTESMTVSPTESRLPQPILSVLPTSVPSPLATVTPPVSVVLVAPQLDEPIYAGDTQITGQGPFGLPIRLYDVGLTGNELGGSVVDEEGTFVVILQQPLVVGQRVGLALGDLSETAYTSEQLQDYAVIDLPVIGLLFADVKVQPRE